LEITRNRGNAHEDDKSGRDIGEHVSRAKLVTTMEEVKSKFKMNSTF
jgi:hypothetical protein